LCLPWAAQNHADGRRIGAAMILQSDTLYGCAGYRVYFLALKP
jgi:hypothetical protein